MRRGAEAAFTLIEMMVVMVLLSVIVIGLMAMFSQVQRAFRAGMAQTDQLETGRMFTDLFARELQQITPTYQTNGLNFYAEIPNYSPLLLTLPANSYPRTNILQDLFFVTRYNQTWNGIGYFVRTNASVFGNMNVFGALYRFETNVSDLQFNGNGYAPFRMFQFGTNQLNQPSVVTKVLDGVVAFHVQCYDPNGLLLTNGSHSILSNNFVTITNSLSIAPGQVGFYGFSNNIVPAYVELEIDVLEPAVLKRLKSIPSAITQSNFLASHAGHIQIFRQRIAIRNVDPSAYNP
jgi:prepilin-type N-terminal cleavage/methylation domain-containing protein